MQRNARKKTSGENFLKKQEKLKKIKIEKMIFFERKKQRKKNRRKKRGLQEVIPETAQKMFFLNVLRNRAAIEATKNKKIKKKKKKKKKDNK